MLASFNRRLTDVFIFLAGTGYLHFDCGNNSEIQYFIITNYDELF